MTRFSKLVSAAFGMAAVACLLPSPGMAEGKRKPIEEQIVEIVGSPKGTVRKWTSSPKVAVIYRDDPFRSLIETEMELIRTNVPEFPGFGAVEYFDLGTISGSLYGKTLFKIADGESPGTKTGLIAIYDEVNKTVHQVSADIFIYISSVEDGVLFGAIIESSGTQQRGFAQRTGSCHYKSFSKDEQMVVGNIVIDKNNNAEVLEGCIHEEITQALGLLNDSPDSEFFTYDNKMTYPLRYENDFKLLRALYSGNIAPGDDPSKVVANYLQAE
jgi:Protein of unknown function (DUF2927)